MALLYALAGGAAAQGSCNCDDVLDLQSRYCQVRDAVGEWDRLIRWTDGRVEKRQEVELYGGGNKTEVEECVDDVIGMVRNEFRGNRTDVSKVVTRSGKGATDNGNCDVTVDAPTACLREVLANHEAMHHRICKAATSPDAVTDADVSFIRQLAAQHINWRYGTSLMAYMQEERAAYSSEMADLLDKLQKLSEKCPAAFFERQTPTGKKFSLTPCPNPNPEGYRKELKCKRL